MQIIINRLMTHYLTIRRWLTEPLYPIREEIQRRRLRVLSVFLLVFALSSAIGTFTIKDLGMDLWLFMALTTSVLVVAYFLSRTRYNKVAIVLALTVPVAPSLSEIYINGSNFRTLSWLTLPLLISAIALRRRYTIIITIGYVVASILSVPFTGVDIWNLIEPLSFILITAVFVIIISTIQRQDQSQLEEELIERRQLEDALQDSNRHLEAKVLERTSKLAAANEALQDEIAERQQAQRVLTVQKELIGLILDSMPNAVLVLDRNQQISIANRLFYDTFNVKEAELGNRRLDEIITVPELCEAVSSVPEKGDLYPDMEFKYKVQGIERDFVTKFMPIEEEKVLLVLTDITEEREKQEKLYLADRLAAVGEIAAGIAHEINNPLTGIVALSQLLLEDNLPEEVIEDIRDINNEAKRATNTIKNVLVFARKRSVQRQMTQINEVIEEVLRLRAYEHKINNVHVSTNLDPGLPYTMADYFQLQQVFLDIIINAEFSMTEVHRDGNLSITTGIAGDTIKITITDDGPGIEEEVLKHIFDPFFTTKEIGQGTGLGLSICYGIVKKHGGRIYARNDSRQGTSFIIELPVNNSGQENENRDSDVRKTIAL